MLMSALTIKGIVTMMITFDLVYIAPEFETSHWRSGSNMNSYMLYSGISAWTPPHRRFSVLPVHILQVQHFCKYLLLRKNALTSYQAMPSLVRSYIYYVVCRFYLGSCKLPVSRLRLCERGPPRTELSASSPIKPAYWENGILTSNLI